MFWGRDCSNGASTKYPKRGKGLQICLDTRSTTRIGSGDGKRARWVCSGHFHIEYASGNEGCTQKRPLKSRSIDLRRLWHRCQLARLNNLRGVQCGGRARDDRRRLGADFADEWRAWYGKSTRELSSGDGPWRLVDDIHREKLDVLLKEYGLSEVMSEESKQHLNRAWHRLDGWPDSPSGLRRLKSKYIIATASNGNLALLVNMAKHADLPWDAVMSPDVYGAYKPSPKVYQNASKLLGLTTDRVMMVAAHTGDLEASTKEGLATAFVHRPLEHGADKPFALPDTSAFDITATDFNDLADQLGCD